MNALAKVGFRLLPRGAALIALCVGSGFAGAQDGGQALRIVQQSMIQSLNQNVESTRSSARVGDEILEAPVGVRVANGKLELFPKLATSWQQIDESTWRFKVRPGVTFSNGEPLTSEAFAKTLQFWRAFPGGRSAASFANIEINVVDDMTFDVKTKEPNLSSLPAQMSYFVVAPPRYHESLGTAADAQVAFGNRPIGTGPFILDSWDKGVVIKLKANPNYWGAKPAIQRVEIRSAPNPATRVSLLQSGAADIVGDIPISLYSRISAMPGKKMVSTPSDFRVFLALNMTMPPTNNALVRQAISFAIGRKLIISKLLRGHGKELQGIFVPGELGYAPGFVGYAYDPAKARALLKEAGLQSPIPLTINYSDALDISQQLAEVIQAQLEEVGFRITMKGGPNQSQQPLWVKPGASEGAYLLQMGPVYPDPNFLMTAAYFGPSSVYRAFGTDERLAEISRAAASAKTDEERQKLYEQAQKRAIEELTMWMPLYVRELGYGTAGALHWNPTLTDRFDLSAAKFQ